MKITGKLRFVNINEGAWVLDGEDDNVYELINCPEQIKYPEKVVSLKIQVDHDASSMNMVGIPAKVIEFET